MLARDHRRRSCQLPQRSVALETLSCSPVTIETRLASVTPTRDYLVVSVRPSDSPHLAGPGCAPVRLEASRDDQTRVTRQTP